MPSSWFGLYTIFQDQLSLVSIYKWIMCKQLNHTKKKNMYQTFLWSLSSFIHPVLFKMLKGSGMGGEITDMSFISKFSLILWVQLLGLNNHKRCEIQWLSEDSGGTLPGLESHLCQVLNNLTSLGKLLHLSGLQFLHLQNENPAHAHLLGFLFI